MVYPSQNIDNQSLSIPITSQVRETAKQFALEQPTLETRERVYFNTLAVSVVRNYLQWIGIETNLNDSDSWNSIARLCADIADLIIVGVGRLECRPVKPNQVHCFVPPEVWQDRLGYVVVRIHNSLKQAMILGFVYAVNSEEVPLSHLQPIEALLPSLHRDLAITRLGRWVGGQFEVGWQSVEELFRHDKRPLAFQFRMVDNEPIRRGKLLDLGLQLGQISVVLLVAITPKTDRLGVCIQVHPNRDATYLPPNLGLRLLSDRYDLLQEVRSRDRDNYIQLPRFHAESGERFHVQIALEDAMVTETFSI